MYVYLGITLNFLQLVISRANMFFIRLLVQLYEIDVVTNSIISNSGLRRTALLMT